MRALQLHELTHNEVGPHNESFWHLFCQLKSDYLRYIHSFSSRGLLYRGKSAVQLADAAAEVGDVRGAVLAALERDRQMPAGPMQPRLLDEYLAAVERMEAGERAAGTPGGSSITHGGVTLGLSREGDAAAEGRRGEAMSQEERRALLAARASARFGGQSTAGTQQPPAPVAASADAPATELAFKLHEGTQSDHAEPPVDVADSDGGEGGRHEIEKP